MSLCHTIHNQPEFVYMQTTNQSHEKVEKKENKDFVFCKLEVLCKPCSTN